MPPAAPDGATPVTGLRGRGAVNAYNPCRARGYNVPLNSLRALAGRHWTKPLPQQATRPPPRDIMTQRVLTQIDDDGNATLILNRPEVHNAFDPEMAAEMTAALKRLEADPGVRAVVIMAVGRNFSAGADIAHMKASAKFSRAQNVAAARTMAAMFHTLYTLAKPTIAAVRGAVRGGGAGLLAAADIAIGTRDVTIRLTEVRLGIVPAMISPYIVAAIGERMAHRYFLTGEEIDSGEAFRIGLLHDICEEEAFNEKIGHLLHELYQGGPAAIVAAKRALRAVAHSPIDAAVVKATAERIADIRATPEAQEGLAAFLGKRPPAWTARPAPAAKAARAKPAKKRGR